MDDLATARGLLTVFGLWAICAALPFLLIAYGAWRRSRAPRTWCALLLLVLPIGAVAQPVPPPLFTIEPIPGLCGAQADHVRLLEAAGFEPHWRGDAGRGGSALLVINDQGYWVLLLAFPERPDMACVVADGLSFVYAPQAN